MTKNVPRLLIAAIVILIVGMFILLGMGRRPARYAQTGEGTPIPVTSNLIAYTSHRDGHAQIYILDLQSAANGNPASTNISQSPSNDTQPTWSPDGKSIGYVSDRDGNTEICVMDSDGANKRCLTNHKTANKKPDKSLQSDSFPLWSPDGLHIAYVATINGRTQIWVMDSDGSNAINLSNNNNNNDQPAWSPDLKQIAYVSNRNGNNALCLMDGSGFNQRCITNNPTGNRRPDPKKPEDTYPKWSPDSKTLAFSSTRAQNRDADIYVINSDGSGDVVNLTQNIGTDTQPTWSPDEQHIVFVSNRGGSNQLWEMNADGSNQTPLTEGNGKGGDVEPAWQPAPPNPNATPTQTLTPTPNVTRTPLVGVEVGTTLTAMPSPTHVLSPTPGNSPNIGVTISSNFGFVGQPVVWDVAGTGGIFPYTYNQIGGAFPPGLTLSGTQIIGTPTTAGSYTFTLSATDVNGFGGNRTFTVGIFTISPSPLPTATVGVAYTQPVIAITGGLPPYTVTRQSGLLPSGLVLNSDGSITGTPIDVAGPYSFTVQVVDSNNVTFTKAYSITLQPGIANKLVFQTQPTTSTAGVTIPTFTVLVEDQVGNVLTNNSTLQVDLAVSDASANPVALFGAPFPPLTITAGVVSFSGLNIHQAGINYKITASLGSITKDSSLFNINPAATSQLAVTAFPPTAITTAGVVGDVSVTAQDQFGNTTPAYVGTVHFTSSDAQLIAGDLPADYTFVAGDSGSHTFTGGVTLKTAGTQTDTATDTGTPAITGTQTGIQVNPAAAQSLKVTGYPASTVAGTAHNFTVTAYDPYGNIATGYTGTVKFTSTDVNPLTVLPANYTFVAGDNGAHTFSATLTTVGTQTITATDTVTNTITGSQSGITVTPAAAKILTVTGYASPTVAGTSNSFTVTAYDPYGNIATGYTGTVHFTSTDVNPLTVLPANYTFVAGDSGVHNFNATLTTVGTQSLTATDTVTATITGTQSGIVVTPAAATHFNVAGYPASTVAGVAHNVNVTALDTFGNIDTNYAGTVDITSSDAAAVLPPSAGLTSGVGSFSVTLTTVAGGNKSITATDSVTTSITGSQTGIAVTPAAATHFSVAGYPASTVAGVAHNVTVTALDAFNNIDTNFVGNVTITSSDAAATLPAPAPLIAGVRAFAVTLKTVVGNPWDITATQGAITGSQTGIVVTPAAATHFSVTGYPSPTVAGVAHNVTVTALDAFNNTDTNFVGNVTITSSDAAATLPVPGPLTAGVGTFSVTLKTVAGGNKSITATRGVVTGSQTGIVVTPAAATHFSVTGYPASTVAGVAHNVTVTALDAFNNIDTNFVGNVTITSSDAAATLPAPGPLTAGVGTFSVTLTTVVGSPWSITATQGAITGSQTGIVVTPAAATHFSVTGYPASTVAGVAHNVTVTALDAFNNVVTGFAGNVTITSTDAAATLPAPGPLTSGVGTFSVTLKTVVGNPWSITATQGAITGSQTGIVVTPAAATHFGVAGYPSPTVAGVAHNVTVTALDAFNNTDINYAGIVTITSSDPAATLSAPATLTAGVGAFSVTLKTVAGGSKSITATQGAITGSQVGIVVTPDVTSQLTLSAFPPTATATAGIAGNVIVTAQDQFGNTTPAYTGTIHFTSSDIAAVLPADYTFVAGDNGVHTFTGGATLKTVGTQSITATDTGTPSITDSQNVTVNPAATSKFVVVAFPPTTTTTAGVAGNVIVTAQDQFGNTTPAYVGTVHFTSSDTAALLPANYTFVAGDNGVHTFTGGATLKTAGTQSITATDTVTSSITGSQTGIIVNPAATSKLKVAAFPPTTTATAGVAGDVTVTAQDQFGNTTPTYTGTIQFTTSDPQDTGADLPANYTFVAGDNGVHTFSGQLTLKTAPSQTVTATDTVTSSITGTQTVTVNPEPTTNKIVIVAFPPTATATAGVAGNVTVTAQDQFGNTTPIYTGTIHFTSSDPAAVLPADYTFVAGDNGVHTFTSGATLKTVGTQSITATDTGTPGITDSQNVTVNPAAASHFTVTGYPASTVAGVAHNVTVTALDAFNNIATSYGGTVTITSSDGAATLPGSSTLTSGVGTFSVTLKTVAGGNKTITATQSAITGSQTGITVTPDVTSQLAVSAFPPTATTTAGVAGNVIVTAQDQFGNTTPTYTGTIHFTSSDPAAVLPADYTFVAGDNGVHTFVAGVTLKTTPSQTVVATDTGTPSITDSQTITVNPAAATHFSVTGYPVSTVAGVAHNVTVTALDAFNNVVTGFVGNVTITSTDPAATLPASGPLTTGVGTFSVTLKTVAGGNKTITATQGVITGNQTGIAVTPAAATHFSVAGYPASTVAGTAHNVTVTALDTFNNTDTNFVGNVAISSSDGAATLPAPGPLTAGVGTFSVTLNTIGVGRTITATQGAVTGSQTGITVTP